MKRLLALLMALAGLTALFAGCGGGGEEEAGILAVAFRLDEGSPVMVAYIGDPTEDPFELPGGRYYIEALDGDDVLISLGAVDIEDGDVVEFPTSFEAASGLADAERAEPLITLASFLIDLELAKYTYLEIVTSGFTVSPFDPSVELDAADFEGLFEMYGDIAEQEDSVLGALDKIEGRAEVSLRIPYVRFPWAPAHGLKEVRRDVLGLFVGMAVFAALAKEMKSSVQVDLGEVIVEIAQDFGAHTPARRNTPHKSEGLLDKERQWQEYAKELLEKQGLSPSAAKDQVKKKIKSDFLKRFPDLKEEADKFADTFIFHVMMDVPELFGEPAPAVAEPEEELAEPSEPEPEGPTEPEPEEPAEPEPEEPSEPEAEEPSEPEPEEPTEPEAEEPSEPEPEEPTEPEAPDVRVEGPWLLEYELSPGCVVEKNTMWLRFSPGGGSGNGKGEWVLSCEHECGTVTTSQVSDYQGIYSPDSNTFGGSWVMQITASYYTIKGEQCQLKSHSSSSAGDWEATLTEGIVKGSNEIGGEIHFELTVQG